MVFTLVHKTFLLESYFRSGTRVDGEYVYSVQICMEEFQAQFTNFVIDYMTFKKTLDRVVSLFRETGSILRKPGSGAQKKRTEEVVVNAQEIMDDAPKTSIRQLSQQVNLSVGTTHKLLHEDLELYPYRITAVQELKPADYPRRLEFCNWVVDKIANNLNFLQSMIWTDEAWFHLSGFVNSRNMRIWSHVNPHVIIQEPLHPEKIGVWAAFGHRRIVGPIFFQGTLNAERYRTEILEPFFEQLDDVELQNCYFQQDGATPHCTVATLDLLREFFDDRLVSRNTEIPWPPRSCDLTPCDFFLWPYIKNSIFQTPVQNLDDLQARVEQKIAEINDNPVLLDNVVRNFHRRVLKCMDEGGQHFQHLL